MKELLADLRAIATWQYAREPAGPLEALVARCTHRLPEAVMILDASSDPSDPVVLWVNDSFCRMTGYTGDEIVGRTISLFHGDRTEAAEVQSRTDACRSGVGWVGETWLDRKNGQPFLLHATMAPVRPEESASAGWFVLVARDVTQQRRADQELARRTRELETITTHSPDVILRLDENGRFTYANDVAAEVLGLRPGAMQLRTLEEVARQTADRDQLAEEFRAVIRDPERRTVIVQSPFPRSDRMLEVRMVPEFGGAGVVEHVVWFIRDVSDRVRAEEGLRESEERRLGAVEARLRERELEFRDLAESVPVYIWMTDEHGQSVFVNQAWARFTAAEGEPDSDAAVDSRAESSNTDTDAATSVANDLAGEAEVEPNAAASSEADGLPVAVPIRPALATDWRSRIHPEDLPGFNDLFAAALDQQKSFEMVCRVRRGDGTYRALVMNGMPRFDASRFIGVLGTGVDITGQRHREEMQRIAVAELEHASRLTMAGQMAAAMVHEMSQPLSALAVFIELAHRHLLGVQGIDDESGDPVADASTVGETSVTPVEPSSDQEAVGRAMASLRDAQRNALRAGVLSRNMLQFVRRRDPRPSRVDFGETVRKSMGLMRADASDHQVRLDYDGTLDGVNIVADPVELEQVLCNLTRNACEAIASRPHEGGRIGFSGKVQGTRAMLWVEDNGPGIPDSVRETVFEPFHTMKETGVGLGLWICWNILERYVGTIRVAESGPDGTSFEIGLHLAPESVDGSGEASGSGSGGLGEVISVEEMHATIAAARPDAPLVTVVEGAAKANGLGAMRSGTREGTSSDAARRVQEDLALPDSDGKVSPMA